MPKYYEQIQGWADDIVKLYQKMVDISQDGAVFLEIGTWIGRSTIYMGEAIKESNKNIHLYSIDSGTGSPEHKEYIQRYHNNVASILTHHIVEADLCSYITYIMGRSEIEVKLFADNSLDFVFIDGDHSSEAIARDINMWWPKVKEGGVLAGHDYYVSGYHTHEYIYHPDIKNVVDTTYPGLTVMVGDHTSSCWGVRKSNNKPISLDFTT